jgi:NAD(P)-dependent dehydrogenase (short-subunit alcohol dehydrogenase family)
MIADTMRAAARIAVRAGRHVPLAGPLLGGGERLGLDGRVVFVTGAARGLGAEVARQSYAKGAYVSLVGRRLAPLEQLAARLGDRAAAFEADVTDFDALCRAAQGTVERFGGIDVTVANAGVAPPADTVMTIDPEAFERTVDIDLLGQWRTIRATLPSVAERHGHILVIASIYAFFNGALNASYAASKAGIEQLTRAVRVELVHHGATAGIAYLGFVETDLAVNVFKQETASEARKAVPSFFTKPISVEDAGRVLIDGIERRAARVGAPGWVLPMLAMRGMTTTLMDEAMLRNRRLSRTIDRAERAKQRQAEQSAAPPAGTAGETRT